MIATSAEPGDCADAAWFPTGLDAAARQIRFGRTTRGRLSAAPFLDERFAGQVEQLRTMSFDEAGRIALADDTGATSPPAFIFHTAFCCSTLLARALDHPAKALSLKEPAVLMDLANVRRVDREHGADEARYRSLAQTVFGLLGRRFEPSERIVIKPTNAANRLLPSALAHGSPILLLYSDLPSFLVSVIKKGEACRYFVRHLLNIFRLDRPDIDAWPERQLMLLTDLQVAALVWHIQIEQFEQVLELAGGRRVRSLETERFLGDPAGTLADVAALFGLDIGADELAAVAEGPLFRRDAKFSDKDYDASLRRAEKAEIRDAYRDEIDVTLEWARRLRQGDVPERLANPL